MLLPVLLLIKRLAGEESQLEFIRLSHVTSYPARSRDRSCDRHTVTATRPPPHGHRHMVTATWLQPPLVGLRAGPCAGSRAGPCARSCDESCARLCVGTFDHENSLRALGPRAFLAVFGPLAPTATLSLWPVATFSLWPTPFVNHGRWRPLSLGGPWPLAASNLRRPLAHGAPLATVGYQGVIVIRNSRVIEPIVRGGGHGGRGGLGGMSWWCGGMSWKWCGRKVKSYKGLLGVDATG